jgi:3-keto-5-aminohexanoate cleavage enzyme
VFFPNHRDGIERFAHEMAIRGVKPELEVYNSAMLEEVAFLFSLGIFEPPYTINFVLQTPTQGGVRGTPRNVLDLVARCDELPVGPEDLRINISSMGSTQLPITTMAIAMGLNVRVGMEDNVFYRKGELLDNNAQLVERTARIANELERRPATPAEAREILGTRGREHGRLPEAVGPAVATPS